MLTIIVFNALQVFASGYAVWRGGAPERAVSCMLLMAALVTLITDPVSGASFVGVNWWIASVDIALLAGLVTVAIFADRYWPLWLASLHLMVVAAHCARAFDATILPYAYWWLVNKAAYPMLAILAAGTWRNARRCKYGARDYGWTFNRFRVDERACSHSGGG